MNLSKAHYYSGIRITVFISLHLFNHLVALFGIDTHIQLMNTLRLFYRNIFIETALLSAVALQIFSGGKLFWQKRKTAVGFFEQLQILLTDMLITTLPDWLICPGRILGKSAFTHQH